MIEVWLAWQPYMMFTSVGLCVLTAAFPGSSQETTFCLPGPVPIDWVRYYSTLLLSQDVQPENRAPNAQGAGQNLCEALVSGNAAMRADSISSQ